MQGLERWNEPAGEPPAEAVMRGRLEALGYAVRRYTYPPGTVFPEHVHAHDKIDAVLSGRFRMTLPGGDLVLGAGDCLHVPAGVPHAARVVGAEPVVSLDAERLP